MSDKPQEGVDIEETKEQAVLVDSSLSNNENSTGVSLQSESSSCGCNNKSGSMEGASNPTFVYAIGKVEPRFPSPDLEREYQQVIAKSDTKGQTDFEALHNTLTRRENRYILRQMCWVFKVEGLETYVLIPRDPTDLETLAEAIRVPPRGSDVDVIIGTRGPMASPEICGGLMVPIVILDQIYSFDVDTLIKSIPRPSRSDPKKFNATSEELFSRIVQLADNAGSTDEHRAINYLSVRYDAIYALASEKYQQGFSLAGVEVLPSRLSGTRKVVDVIFNYRNRTTDVSELHFVRVAVGKFPYLVSKLAPYYERPI